jgi:hypothetical protein
MGALPSGQPIAENLSSELCRGTSPDYYRSPGLLDDYRDKLRETPHGTQDNTTQPLPPVDKTSPDYYRSPGLLDDYRDKSHD